MANNTTLSLAVDNEVHVFVNPKTKEFWLSNRSKSRATSLFSGTSNASEMMRATGYTNQYTAASGLTKDEGDALKTLIWASYGHIGYKFQGSRAARYGEENAHT